MLGVERIAGIARRCRSALCEHHTVGLIIGDHAGPVRRGITLPVIRVTVAFGMDDAADVHGVRRLPPGLLLLQIDRDGDAGISKQGLRGDLRIGGAHVSQIHRLPALSNCEEGTGTAKEISTATIAMTISISINVKPLRFSFISFSVPVPPRGARQNPAAVIPAGFGCFQVEKNHFFSRMKQDKTGTKLSIKW